MGIGGQALAYSSQAKSAEAQAKYQNQQYEQTAVIAQANYRQQTRQAGLRLQQEAAADSQTALANQVASQQATGQAKVALADRGVAGNSVDSLMQEFQRQEAGNAYALSLNQKMRTTQATEEMKSMEANMYSQIATATPQPVQTPSLLGTMLQIGTIGISSLNSGLVRTRTPDELQSPSNFFFKKRF